jgi:diguanylate cyclase (GGDEF)-like protein
MAAVTIRGLSPSGGAAPHTAGLTQARSAARDGALAADTLQFVWEHHRAETLESVGVIERALARLSGGELDEELRREAGRAAHMLAGSVGTFGFMDASALAHDLELELRSAGVEDLYAIAAKVASLRRELEGHAARGDGSEDDATAQQAPRVLIVDADAELREKISSACSAREMDCDGAADARHARKLIAHNRPDVALLSLESAPEAYALLSELSAVEPPIPALMLTGSGEFTDRVEAARRGSRAFLPRSLSPAEVVSAVEQLLAGERLSATRVLVVDDQPMVLEAMRALLRPHGIAVTTLADPTTFWSVLEEVEPELLILDLDMPHVNGVELCRTVRNDPRWSGLAVIFITASTDAQTIEEVFNAGADDYVAKPIVGPELVKRVSNRLERIRLLRAQAELDGLTGLSNRVTSEQRLKQLLALSARFDEPLSLAMLDVDRFKLINDTHGHAAGDVVLRRLGEYLRREFRGNDVVGRWGGEEFVIGMYGMTCANAERRLADVLERFASEEEFAGTDGSFHVTFSAGVAERQRDGEDLDALCDAADKALYRAKAAGRARVLAAA